ncbi:hypothetical protein [Cohnella abietis]|uniref:hypothetical protein n=1 Tax=Cohnella abietis TaxID=2507935 RepID=UPI0013906143|nr:hypothetical protein [Cohnella abietis]
MITGEDNNCILIINQSIQRIQQAPHGGLTVGEERESKQSGICGGRITYLQKPQRFMYSPIGVM